MHWERLIVRSCVAAAFMVATVGTLMLDAPEELPAIALDTEAMFRALRGLAFFYIALLAILPFVRGVIRGELPIEVSARGARYQEVATESERMDSTFSDTVDRYRESLHETTLTLAWLMKRVDRLASESQEAKDVGGER